jgi:hypothetical protein
MVLKTTGFYQLDVMHPGQDRQMRRLPELAVETGDEANARDGNLLQFLVVGDEEVCPGLRGRFNSTYPPCADSLAQSQNAPTDPAPSPRVQL